MPAQSGARILFVTWGSLGDLHPYISLALELKRRGHQPAIATVAGFRETVEGAGLRCHSIRPDVSLDDKQALQHLVRRVLDSRDGSRFLFQGLLNPALRDTYEDTLAAIEAEGGVDLLVSHQVPLTTPIVADKTRTKWVSGVLLPMAFLSEYDPATPPQAPWLQPVMARHPMVARAMSQLARWVTHPWMKPIYRLRAELGLAPGGNPVFEGQHSPWLALGLFSPLLASAQPDYPAQARITGFAFYDGADQRPPSSELIRFLEGGEPPILFTLGSSAVWIAGDFYRTSVEAMRRLGRRAVFLAGEDAVALRASLPSSMLAVDYAPHGFIMPAASAVVHQGGVGTTGQALRSGRPMLVVPFGQDQPDNARRCVKLGVARTIERRRYTADALARELDLLLADRRYVEDAARVGDTIGAENGTQTACDLIEKVLSG